MSEFQFACEKCPRTFKLQEFYDKHKKVHDLKKQHRCHICGFVYGAAKGLEGNLADEGPNWGIVLKIDLHDPHLLTSAYPKI